MAIELDSQDEFRHAICVMEPPASYVFGLHESRAEIMKSNDRGSDESDEVVRKLSCWRLVQKNEP